MVFAFEGDSTLSVYPDANAAAGDHEPIDVEQGAVAFFADDGSRLRPRFTRLNQRSLFGLVVDQGAFVLEEPTFPVAGDIEGALQRTTSVNPNPYFASLEAVRQHFAARRRKAAL
jgi:hypothetical protein